MQMVTNQVVPKNFRWKEIIPFHAPTCPQSYSPGKSIQSKLIFGFLGITFITLINMLYLLFLFTQFKTLILLYIGGGFCSDYFLPPSNNWKLYYF